MYSLDDLRYYSDTGAMDSTTWVRKVSEGESSWLALADVLEGESVQDVVSGGGTSDIFPGSHVEALFAEDGCWYAGVIVSADAGGSHFRVKFDGYEGEVVCSQVRLSGQHNTEQGSSQQQSAKVGEVPAPLEQAWYTSDSAGLQSGPFSDKDVRTKILSGSLLGTDWVTDSQEWFQLSTVAKFASTLTEKAQTKSVSTAAPEPQTLPAHSQSSAGVSARAYVAKQTRSRQGGSVVRRKSSVANRNDSFDRENATAACKWMEMILGRSLDTPDPSAFKDYIAGNSSVLCELFDALLPGRIGKYSKSKLKFKRLETVSIFLSTCRSFLSMTDSFLPSPGEVTEGKNFDKLIACLERLSMLASKEYPPTDAPPTLQLSRKKRGRRFQ